MTNFGTRQQPYPKQIPHTIEVSVDDSNWTPVTISADPAINTKALAAKLRSADDWKLSEESDGATYITVAGTLNIDIVVAAGGVAFYVQTASGDDTLEVLVLT